MMSPQLTAPVRQAWRRSSKSESNFIRNIIEKTVNALVIMQECRIGSSQKFSGKYMHHLGASGILINGNLCPLVTGRILLPGLVLAPILELEGKMPFWKNL